MVPARRLTSTDASLCCVAIFLSLPVSEDDVLLCFLLLSCYDRLLAFFPCPAPPGSSSFNCQ